MDYNKTYQTDWLASNPVFYNEKTCKISHNINDVIDFNNVEFHPEGLNNYLDYGYAVFEQTPLKHVKFLPHSSTIEFKDDKLFIVQKDDIAEIFIGKETQENDVLHLLDKRVNEWSKSVEGEIILPLSGGYDSRLLAFLIKNKNRVHAFSFGISNKQEESYEVIKAKKVAELLDLKWNFIPLGLFHNYFDNWDELYGISTHAHGMYHIEFYKKLLPFVKGGNPFLSGIIGDAWAGSLNFGHIDTYHDLNKLAITHGMHANSLFCKVKSEKAILETNFNKLFYKLQDDRFHIVESMRLKLILLSYLMKVPAHFGFKPWSPFLEPDIALSMLNLPPERRKNRVWQSDFFRINNLDVENHKLDFAWENTLNNQAINNITPVPLSRKLLREIFDENYIEQINKVLAPKSLKQNAILKLMTIWGSRGLLYRMGYNQNSFDKPHQEILKAYCAYLTLKPIENILIKRNSFAQIKR